MSFHQAQTSNLNEKEIIVSFQTHSCFIVEWNQQAPWEEETHTHTQLFYMHK